MNDVLKLTKRLSFMSKDRDVPEVHVSRSIIMRLVLVTVGLLLVVPPEAQKAGVEAVNAILDEAGIE